MMTAPDCDCPGCVYDGECYWPQGETGRAPWSPDTLDPVELPERVRDLITDLAEPDEQVS